MKTIICGSREVNQMDVITKCIKDSGFEITEVVSGTARGADFCGEIWATLNKIAIKRFPADWNNHGKAAGFIRNQEMVDYVTPDGAMIALWDGKSKGTANSIKLAKKAGIKLKVFIIDEPNKRRNVIQ